MSIDTKAIAIIPAKGTSLRLPGKNIRPFFDHPLLAYTIAAARKSQLFDRIVVSTDHALTGEIAEWYGAMYLPRPAHLATENASLVDVALHVLETLDEDFDVLCQLMANCPLRNADNIVEHYQLFTQHPDRHFQISVVPYRGVYPHWALATDETGAGDWFFGKQYLVNSQNLPQTYCPTGAIWWANVQSFREQKTFYGSPFHLAVLDGNRGIDIDRDEEMEMFEITVRGLWSRDGINPLEVPEQSPFPLQDMQHAVYYSRQGG